MDFYHHTGKMALGSRLRKLSERFSEEAVKIFAMYEVPLDPKWFPVFYVLSQKGESSIKELAEIIGHSHASVSQIVKEMTRRGFTTSAKHHSDARVSVVRLTEQGKKIQPKIALQYTDVTKAVDELMSEMQNDFWRAIEEIEFLLDQKDIFTRVREKRKERESQNVEILDYSPEFREDFQRLNYEWIEHYFQIEDTDRLALDHPEKKILNPGGHIFMARYGQEIVGTCALIKMDSETYELAKMAVTEKARGKKIGWLLGQACIQKCRQLGAHRLFLESNTRLEPAINLYYKLGFQRVTGPPSPYARCNIQMELPLVS